jgi:Bacterial Ig domain
VTTITAEQERPPAAAPEQRHLAPGAPSAVRRFTVVALGAIIAAAVPYLWVLFDLWTGSINPLQKNAQATYPGSAIYDDQARALLGGHLSLPQGSIGLEAFIHDGRTYTYFGLFPSLIRMPFLALTHSLDGRLSALSMLAAWLVTAFFATALVWRIRTVVRGGAALGWAETASYGVLLFSILAGSVLVFLASTPYAFNEDEAWSVALACGSIFTLLGLIERPSWRRLIACGVLVLLTNLNRPTTGYACILATFLVAAWFALGRAGPERRRWALPLLIAGLVAMAVGCAIDLAKFSVFFGYPASEQLLYRVYGFSHVNGGRHYSLNFLPSTLDFYLSPGNLRVSSVFPYLTMPAVPAGLVAHTTLFNQGNTASASASMPLLFLAGVWGAISTFRRHQPMVVRSFKILLLAAAATAGALLIYGSIFDRFLGDFMPLLVLASTIGIVDLWQRLGGGRRLVRVLFLGTLGVLALFGFVANMGIAVAPQVFWTQTQADHFVRAEQVMSNLTGHPLSGDVVRGNGFPTKAPIGQLFIKGRCEGLYIAYQAVPYGHGAVGAWLPVERAPHTPICDSLIGAASNILLSTTVVTPFSGETVSGSHVILSASTYGVGKVSSVTFLLAGGSGHSWKTLGRGAHTGSRWTYVWDTRNEPNGPYLVRSEAASITGYRATSSLVFFTLDNT